MAAKFIDLVLRMVDRVSPSTNQIARNLHNLQGQTVQFQNQLSRIANTVTLTFGALAAAKFVGFFDSSVESFAKVDEALGRLKTVADTTKASLGNELGAAFKESQNFALQHKFAVEQVLQTYTEFGSAGFSLAQSVQLGSQALFLANAVMLDAGESAKLLASVMVSLGQTTSLAFQTVEDASQRASSALATSIQVFAVTGEELANGLKFVLGSASTLKIEIEDLVTSIGQLNNVGLKGSNAGTALNQVFVNLQKATSKLGLDTSKFIDESGAFKSIGSLLQEVQRKVSDLGPYERFQKVLEGFGVRGSRAIAGLLPFAPVLDAIQERMKKSGDEAKRLSDLFENNLKTALDKTNNAIEVTKQQIGANLAESVKTTLSIFNRFLLGLRNFADAVGSTGVGITALVVLLGGLAAGLIAIQGAFILATGQTISFLAVLKAFGLPFGIFVGILAGITAVIFAFSTASDKARDFQDALKKTGSVKLDDIDTQLTKIGEALITVKNASTASTESLSKAQTILNETSATTFGDEFKRINQEAQALGVSLKTVSDNFNKAFTIAASASPLKNFGLAGLDANALKQQINLIDTFKQVRPSLSQERTSLGIFHDRSFVGSDEQRTAAKAAIIELANIGEAALKSEDALKKLNAQIGGPGLNQTKAFAESLVEAKDKITGFFSGILPDSQLGVAIDIIGKTGIPDLAAKMEKALEPTKKVSKELGIFFDATSRADQASQAFNQTLANLNDVRDELQAKGTIDLPGNITEQINLIQRLVRQGAEKASFFSNEVVEGQKALAATAGKGVAQEFIDSINSQLDHAKLNERTALRDFEKIQKDLELAQLAFGAGLLPIPDPKKGKGDFETIISEGLKNGFKKGIDEGRLSIAQGLIDTVDKSITQGALLGFSSFSRLGALQPFLNSIEEQAGVIFTKVQAGFDISETINKSVGALKTGFDLKGLDSGFVALNKFRQIVLQELVPSLDSPLQQALKRGLEPLDKAEEQISKLRAQLLTVQTPIDRSVIEQLIGFNRGEGSVGGINISGADINTKVKALENLVKQVTVSDGSNIASSQTIQLILDAYQKIVEKQEKIKQGSDISANFDASNESVNSTSQGVGKLSESINGIGDVASRVTESFNSWSSAIDSVLPRLQEVVEKVGQISGNVNSSSDTKGSEINLRLGDFSINIETESHLDEEEIEKIKNELKPQFDEIQTKILDQIEEVLRHR